MERRSLRFNKLGEATQEAKQLLAAGYQRTGNWTLGQVCRHVSSTIHASMDGYPAWMIIGLPLRPILRWFVMPSLLNGNAKAGIPTANVYLPPDSVEDRKEVDEFVVSVERYLNHTGKLYPHPGFGRMDHELFGRFHAAHAAHHFSFLVPKMEVDD